MKQSPHIFEVSTVEDFQERVMRRSLEVPVLVDFWASWCGPCKTLTPVLEALAEEYGGRFELAKVNTEEARQIAAAFRIQSIPTVYLFMEGQPVDGFQGAQPEKTVRQFLDQFLPPPEADPLEVAREAVAAGEVGVAAAAFQEVLAKNPTHGEALIGLARIALGGGDTAGATALLDRIPPEDPHHAQGERMRGVFAFGEDAGDLRALEAQVAATPGDVAAWYALGATRATLGDMAGACAAFLKVVTLDREFRDDAGRAALLSIFDLLGADDPVVGTYRRRLSAFLF